MKGLDTNSDYETLYFKLIEFIQESLKGAQVLINSFVTGFVRIAANTFKEDDKV